MCPTKHLRGTQTLSFKGGLMFFNLQGILRSKKRRKKNGKKCILVACRQQNGRVCSKPSKVQQRKKEFQLIPQCISTQCAMPSKPMLINRSLLSKYISIHRYISSHKFFFYSNSLSDQASMFRCSHPCPPKWFGHSCGSSFTTDSTTIYFATYSSTIHIPEPAGDTPNTLLSRIQEVLNQTHKCEAAIQLLLAEQRCQELAQTLVLRMTEEQIWKALQDMDSA